MVLLFPLYICYYNSFSNKLAYDTTHIDNYLLNLLQRPHSCGIITINYIQLPPLLIWNCVIDVEDTLVSLVLLSIYSYSFSNKLANDNTHINNYSLNMLKWSHSYGVITIINCIHSIAFFYNFKLCHLCREGDGIIDFAVYLILLFLK